MKDFKNKLKKMAVMLLVFALGITAGSLLHALSNRGGTEEGKRGVSSHISTADQTLWTCSMHPNIKLPKPGKCPICFMDLVPLGIEDDSNGERVIAIGDHAAKMMELETSPVIRRFVPAEIRMSGRIDFDETRVAYISAWVAGRLDRLFVNYTGIPVKKGEHLVEIYSPELLVAQEELLQAKITLVELKQSGSPVILETASSTVDAAREKLRLLGLREEQIETLEKTSRGEDHITIYSPANGIVIDKNANEGMYVKTGTRIYTIADLSKLWVILDAYESDLDRIKYGGNVEITAEAYPGEMFEGIISFVDPIIDSSTRTAKVRVVVDNSSGRLKPGMFVRAVARPYITEDGHFVNSGLSGKWISPMHPEVVKDSPGKCDVCGMDLVPAESLGYVSDKKVDAPLLVPASAALQTGGRAVVYVQLLDRKKPTYQGREVVLGPRLKDFYVVKSGLKEGELVVTRGAFKLDAELQIRAKPSMMSPSADVHEEHGVFSDVKQDVKQLMAPMEFHMQWSAAADAYFEIQKQLAGDSAPAAKIAAADMKGKLEHVDMALLTGDSHMAWVKNLKNLNNVLAKLSKEDRLEQQREQFYQLSQLLLKLIKVFPLRKPVYQAFCPMAFNNAGAIWLQESEEILNPYFGEVMLHCGEVQEKIGATDE